MYGIGSGARYTARAVARVGELVLNRGAWKGRQILTPESVDAITGGVGGQPGQLASVLSGSQLPMGWSANREGVWASLPSDAYAATGSGHQIVLLIPSLDMVVVRQGSQFPQSGSDSGLWPAFEQHLFEPLMDAVDQP